MNNRKEVDFNCSWLPSFQTSAAFCIALMNLVIAAPLAMGQALVLPGAGSQPKDLDQAWIAEQIDSVVKLYRHLHQHPELSFEERETSEAIAKELRVSGLSVTTDVGGHGVVGVLRNGGKKTLMLRADLDGLPVREETGLTFASKVSTKSEFGQQVDVMHACGHDIHMANLIGVVRYLAQHKTDWSGTLLVIGQPAEERGAGAKSMLADGLFDRFPRPDFALAFHVDAGLRTGDVAFRAGYQQANVDTVDITVKGRGGHGAYPHATVDPVVQAAQLVLALQTIVSREVDPTQPAVVTVGSIHGGTKHNVIGNECHLQLTVRSYSDEVRRQLCKSIQRIAEGVAQTAGAPEPKIKIEIGTPALKNDADLARRLRPLFESAIGPEHVHVSSPLMGGEDFSRYGRAGVPILMMRLGSVNELRLKRFESLGVPPPSLHSSQYYPDAKEALTCGIRVMTTASLNLLHPE